MNIDELVSKIVDGVTKSLKEYFSEEWVKEAAVSGLIGKSGQIEGFVSDQPVAETPVAEVPVVTEAQEATTGGLVKTPQSEKSSIMEKVKAVKTHLVNAGQQISTEIPSEVAKKLINNIPKDKLNINKTSEESKEESNITVVPPVEPVSLDIAPVDGTSQVEEVVEPEIKPLPGVDEDAPEKEIQEGQPLPGVEETNEQNVNNQSVENTVNNDVSSLSDAGGTLTAADLVNEGNQNEVSQKETEIGNSGKAYVKSANDVATKV